MNIDKYIFYITVIWYFYSYGPPPLILNIFLRINNFSYQIIEYYNNKFNSFYLENETDSESGDIISNENISNEENVKPQQKYEDKYLNDIRKLSKEWIFTEEEKNEIVSLTETFYNGNIESSKERIEEICLEIIKLEQGIAEDTEDINCTADFDDNGNEVILETLEERNETRRDEIKKLQEEYNDLKSIIDTEKGLIEIKNQSHKRAENFIINKRIDKIKNCYVLEKTPIGNVLMIYQKDRESFKYFSDCNIPYRYLEVVARKYVKVFDCRPIFVDMEEELKLFEEKWNKEQELKRMKEEDENKNKNINKNSEVIQEKKKSVFTKFKSYNKEAGGKISMAAPPKNSIPNKSVTETKENEKILLKEKANRYTYEGKFANFNFTQKIERKVFDKKLGLSFADFKKMQNK